MFNNNACKTLALVALLITTVVFFFVLVTTSVYLFPNFSGQMNYFSSTLLSSGLVFLLSTGSK